MTTRYGSVLPTPGNWVGFDHIFNALGTNTETGYPPHNIVKVDDNNSIIELAVAGFGPEDLDIEWKGTGELTIKGRKANKDDDEKKTYTVRNIAGRSFTKEFRLSEHVVPKAADYKDGILSIGVERVIPESEKPKKLLIGGSASQFLREGK